MTGPNLWFLIVYLVVVGAIVVILLAYMRRVIGRLPRAEYLPIGDPYKPPEVLPTAGVRLVAMFAGLWVSVHVILVSLWLVNIGGDRTALGAGYALFVLVAALVGLCGAVMLGARRRIGRRLVGWGMFLFLLVVFWMLGFAAGLPTKDTVPPEIRGWETVMFIILLIHGAIDAALGAAAQRVGKPAGAAAKTEPSLEDRQAMRQWGT